MMKILMMKPIMVIFVVAVITAERLLYRLLFFSVMTTKLNRELNQCDFI